MYNEKSFFEKRYFQWLCSGIIWALLPFVFLTNGYDFQIVLVQIITLIAQCTFPFLARRERRNRDADLREFR